MAIQARLNVLLRLGSMNKCNGWLSRGSNRYEIVLDTRWLNSNSPAGTIHPAELNPNDLTIVLTFSAKVLEVIFLPGTWNGFETASTYAEWNLLKNYSGFHQNI